MLRTRQLPLALPLLFAIALTACGGGGSDDGGGGPTPVVATVTVTPSLDTLSALGTTLQYTAVAREADNSVIAGKSFTWNSSQAAASIASTGLATAVAEGTTTITATTDGIAGTATLVVKLPAPVGGTIQGTVTTGSGFNIRAVPASRRGTGVATAAPSQPAKRSPLVSSSKSQVVTRRTRAKSSSIPGEWLVTFRPTAIAVPPVGSLSYVMPVTVQQTAQAMRSALMRALDDSGATVTGLSPAILTARLRVTDRQQEAAVLSRLKTNPAVLSVAPNYKRYAFGAAAARQVPVALPNDPWYVLQAWHYGMIDLPRAWSITKGNASVLVAVIDNGIRFDHPAMAANLTNDGFDFVSNGGTIPICAGGSISISGDGDGYDADPTDPVDVFIDDDLNCITGVNPSGNHGLHVAGTIGAPGNDGMGVSGVAWTVKIRPIRALGPAGGSDYDIAQAILYAAGLPADNGNGGTVTAPSRAPIINMSLGGQGPVPAEQSAVTAATTAGSLIIAAAGNDGNSIPMYPASLPEVVSVSAVGPDGQLATYSSFGANVDIAAPGGDIADGDESFGVWSTAWNFETGEAIYATNNGTSMASPHVAGIAALLLANSPGLTNTQLRTRLENFAIDIGAPGVDQQYGHGLLNAYNSLTQSSGPTVATRVFLYNASTGALVTSVAAGAGGTYQFTGLANGNYRVYAGQDESGDGVYGRGLRRWGAFGGSATPTTITINGTGVTTANFTMGIPIELENNNSIPNADILPVGGYLAGFFSNPASDVDISRVDVATAGQYTFETIPLGGACGFALEEDTIIELLSSGGSVLATSDDIDTDASILCSRISINLAAGTYYLRVSAYSGPGAANLSNRRYSISARSGS